MTMLSPARRSVGAPREAAPATPDGTMKCISAGHMVLAGFLVVAGAHPARGQSPDAGPDSNSMRWAVIDSRRVRYRLQGDTGLTVVLVSGLADGLATWGPVQSRAARFARVLSYDRPGLGASEPGAEPRDIRRMAAELDQLLTQAHLSPPYIVVGHSLGSFVVQFYAAHHPETVVGMVLVDPSLPAFYPRMQALPAGREESAIELRDLAGAGTAVQAEVASLDSDVAQTAALPPLPVMPAVVLTSVHHGFAVADSASLERLWLEEQRRWVAAHPGTRHVVDSRHGHRLQEETPDAVVAAIRSVIARLHRNAGR